MTDTTDIGDLPMPSGFKYKNIAEKGKPEHASDDPFLIRHPAMDVGKRAKIFAPFDALKGFNDAVSSKNVLYTDKKELNEEEQKELDRQLNILHNLTFNRRMADRNRPEVSVTFYVPCEDEKNDAYDRQGQYETIKGICRKVDIENKRTMTLCTDIENSRTGYLTDTVIRLDDILSVEASADIFKTYDDWS